MNVESSTSDKLNQNVYRNNDVENTDGKVQGVLQVEVAVADESNENENADTDASPSQENDGTAPRRTTAVQPVPNLPRAFVHFGSPNLEQCVLSLGQSDYPSSTALFKRQDDDSDSSSSPPRKTQVASLLYTHRNNGNASSRLVADSI